MKLENKIAMITGGDKGIGRAISLLFAKEGATVIFTYHKNKCQAKSTALQIKKINNNIQYFKCDIRNYIDIKKVVNSVLKKYGRIDILVNNAGFLQSVQLPKITGKIWARTIDVNLKGVFNFIQAVTPHMKQKKKGKIINIASIAGVVGSLASIPYGVAKAGVINLTKTLAKEFGKYNININAIAPGLVKTDLIKQINKSLLARLIKEIPLGRIAEPEDIAKAVLFFASSDSDYITGQTLIVDGGRL